MKEIILVRMVAGSRRWPHTIRFAEVGRTLVDDCDADLANHRWRMNSHRRKDGTFLNYAHRYENGKSIRLHREIAARMGFTEDVDHHDGDGLNNQRGNLRPATHQENQMNTRRQGRSYSGFKGVSRASTRSRRWFAQITMNGVKYHLGTFKTREEAARAYDKKAIELFGDRARLNFPPAA